MLLNKSLRDEKVFEISPDETRSIQAVRLVGYRHQAKTDKLERYEREWKTKKDLAQGLKIKTSPLSMQILELLY